MEMASFCRRVLVVFSCGIMSVVWADFLVGVRRSGVVCESRQEGFVDYWGFVISESGGSGMWFVNFHSGVLVENSKKSTCCVYLIICFRKEVDS